MKYKSVALLFVIQLLQFPSFSYIKLISFHSEVNTLYASQIHIFHSDFLFQIYQDFSSFLCLCIYRFLYRKNRIAQHCQTDCCFCPKFQLGTQFSGRRQTSCWKCNDRRIGSVQCLFAEDTEEKKIYLTFDAGFENGNTPAILDALKKHQAPATFLWLEISFRKTKI